MSSRVLGEDGVEDIQRLFSIFSLSDITFVIDALSRFISGYVVRSFIVFSVAS